MKVEVLLSTMNQKNDKFIESMNLQTDTLVINQTNNKFAYRELFKESSKIRIFSMQEKGIGLSRNSALMRAEGDICLLADDDMVYNPKYENIILEAFNSQPNADIILFNVPSSNENRPTVNIKTIRRVRNYNFMRYGAVNIAFRKNSIWNANISFSLLFGGGARYSAGEDSLFLFECLRKGLRIETNPKEIAVVNQEESTWFEGYNDKYFFDKGVFFAALSKNLSLLLVIQFLLRKYRLYKRDNTVPNALSMMLKGMNNFKKGEVDVLDKQTKKN
ncbi:glycosyltransferase family A protein [Rossellomorea marisflavi]|uniref:glycosyltransferase family A protein n=1 Tax=Rossellomorea marisflavi TaxID=189381 RepID=UPI001EE2617C|nr:glycosyltransferase family 2 protein [Rossellomorea marisflavi]UKS64973.1 glycosyltransferase family 2 protein [Rossellomorea marisflavi]